MDTDFPLSKAEQEMILFWRSLTDAEITITYQKGVPIGGKVYYPGFLTLKEVSNRPIDMLERDVVTTGRLLKWGNLSIHVQNGSPMVVLNDSYQNVKFSPETL